MPHFWAHRSEKNQATYVFAAWQHCSKSYCASAACLPSYEHEADQLGSVQEDKGEPILLPGEPFIWRRHLPPP